MLSSKYSWITVGKGDRLPLTPVPPRFAQPLVDQGVQDGGPLTLSVKVRHNFERKMFHSKLKKTSKRERSNLLRSLSMFAQRGTIGEIAVTDLSLSFSFLFLPKYPAEFRRRTECWLCDYAKVSLFVGDGRSGANACMVLRV